MQKQKTSKVRDIPDAFWKNRNWFSKKFPWYLHSIYPQGIGAVFFISKHFPFQTSKWAGSVSGMPGEWFWDENELARMRKEILQRSSKSRALPNKVLKEIRKGLSDFEKVIEEAKKVNIKKLSDKELYHWYEKLYWSEVLGVASWGYITESFNSTGATDWLTTLITKELVDKVSEDQLPRMIEILTSPTFASFVNDEYQGLLRIALEINKKVTLKKLARRGNLDKFLEAIEKYPAIKKTLSQHRESYYWIENNYSKVINFSSRYFAQKLMDLIKSSVHIRREYDEERTRAGKNKQAKKKIYQKYNVSQRLQNIIYNAEIFTYVQDIRKQGALRLNHFIFQFIREFSKRVGISYEEAMTTVEPELEAMLIHRKVNRRELKQRVKKWFCYYSQRGYLVLSGKRVDEIDMKVFRQEVGDQKEVKGTVASKGFADGIARVLKSNKDIKLFQKNEILVTNSTTPEFVPAMKKAKAIVTEQGGITTHAAIVSRELGTPCVIGVKDATRIFKTGERIRVDAVKGIVNKL